MTAPADVWAVENPSGKLWSDHDGAPLMWASRELASRARGKRDKVVRFRLVRVDDEQPRGHICMARVPDPEGGRAECSQTIPCPYHGTRYSSEQPPRDEVGVLRECVKSLAHAVCELASHCGDVTNDGYIAPRDAHEIAAGVFNRLTAQSGTGGEVGDAT